MVLQREHLSQMTQIIKKIIAKKQRIIVDEYRRDWSLNLGVIETIFPMLTDCTDRGGKLSL